MYEILFIVFLIGVLISIGALDRYLHKKDRKDREGD